MLGGVFWRVWATQTLSIIGSTVSAIGVAVHVYVETGDARWLGALTAVAAAPYLLVAPLLGRLDRFDRRTTLIAGDVVAAIGPVLALTLAFTGRLEVWQLVAAGFLTGIGNAVQTPASNAAVPALLDNPSTEQLARANGLFQLGPAAGIVLGPALATPLVAWFGVEAVLLVDVVTFTAAIATVAVTRFADPTVDPRFAGVPDDGSWGVAIGWLRREGRALLALLAAMGVINFLLVFFNVSLLALASDVGGTASAGLVVALGGVAMVAGGLVTGALGVGHRPIRILAIALGSVSAGCVIASLRPSLPFVIVGVMVALAPVTVVNAGMATLFQTRVPASMHGRVFAVRSTISRSLDPIGALVAGIVITDVAAPAMRPGGPAGGLLGDVLGTGAERGAALVMLVTGVALAALALGVASSRRLATLDAPTPSRFAGAKATSEVAIAPADSAAPVC